VVEFVWRHSIARPRKLPARRKHLRDISYTSRVIGNFVRLSVTFSYYKDRFIVSVVCPWQTFTPAKWWHFSMHNF